MVNKKFIKRFIASLLVLIVFLVGIFFLVLSNGGGAKSDKQDNTKTETVTKSLVIDFLKSYFTKKKPGSNRSDYKKYMTDSAYNYQVMLEEEPMLKYRTQNMRNFKYKSSKVYLGQDDNVVFVTVKYSSDAYQKDPDVSSSNKISSVNENSLKLTYIQDKNTGKWLIDECELVSLDPVED